MSGWLRALLGRLLLLTGSFVLCLIVAEGLLRAFSYFPIHQKDANRSSHPALGYVMDSGLSDIDRAGFRNADDVDEVELVAIGDSHTYGFNVASEESWPAQLAARSGISVYNYGMGGYGILQYRWLFPKALEKRPETIILALYLANDLGDYCTFAQLDYWQVELRERELSRQECPGRVKRDWDVGEESPSGLKQLWLATAVGSSFEYLLWRENALQRDPDKLFRLAYGDHETFLTRAQLRRHKLYTDLREEPIAEAVRATEVLLGEMLELARAEGVRLAVLFIPSKENVLLDAADPLDPRFSRLRRTVSQERDIVARLDGYLGVRGVPTAYALDCLLKRLDEQLYTRDSNGHPLAIGYACYAEAAMTLLADPKSS